MIIPELSENSFSALASFVYNIGIGAFERSTLLKKLNSGDFQSAADQFLRWNHVNGISVRGLLRRRKLEREIFMADEITAQSSRLLK
jgi:lysozyme